MDFRIMRKILFELRLTRYFCIRNNHTKLNQQRMKLCGYEIVNLKRLRVSKNCLE